MSRSVQEAGGIRITYADGALLPTEIRFSDGSFIEFRFDEDLRPTFVRERSGTAWTRVSTVGDDGLALWKSEDRQQERLAFSVQPNGCYQKMDSLGIVRTCMPSGKTYVGYVFGRGFDFESAARGMFSTADKNLDKALTKIELERTASSRWADQDSAAFAQVLRFSFEQLISMRDDPLMRDAGGLELEELVKHAPKADQMVSSQVRFTPEVEAAFSQLFDSLDGDRDGMICLEELAGKPDLQDALGRAVVRITGSMRDFEPFGFNDRADFIFKPEFLKLSKAVYERLSTESMLPCGWLIEEGMQRTNRSSIPLFSSDSVMESVRVEAIEQGARGSSYFFAALAGAVGSNPNAVPNFVKEKPGTGGAYSISFPGGVEITTELSTNIEVGLRTRGTKYGAWPAVLEKAYEQAKETTPDAVALLTNRPGSWIELGALSDQDLKDKLTENSRQRRVVLFSVHAALGSTQPESCFAVVRFNKDTGNCTLWNHQWSVGSLSLFSGAEQTADNSYTLPIYELKRRFKSVYLA